MAVITIEDIIKRHQQLRNQIDQEHEQKRNAVRKQNQSLSNSYVESIAAIYQQALEDRKKRETLMRSRADLESAFIQNGILKPEYVVNTDEGTIGTISYEAKKALDEGTIDQYAPVDETEKEVLEKYIHYLDSQSPDGWDFVGPSAPEGIQQKAFVGPPEKSEDNKKVKAVSGAIPQPHDITQKNGAPEPSQGKIPEQKKQASFQGLMEHRMEKPFASFMKYPLKDEEKEKEEKPQEKTASKEQLQSLRQAGSRFSDESIAEAKSRAMEQQGKTEKKEEEAPSNLKMVMKNIYGGAAQFSSGIYKTLDFLLPTEILGKYDFIGNALKKAAKTTDSVSREGIEYGYNMGKGRGLAAEFIQGLTAAIPDYATAVMSGGLSLGASLAGKGFNAANKTAKTVSGVKNTLQKAANTLFQDPNFWFSFVRTAGADYEEAKADGMSDLKATAYALTTSGANAIIEIGGGIQDLPGKKGIKSIIKSANEEGIEELLQGMVSNTNRAAMTGKGEAFSLQNEDAVINPKRMSKEYALGASIGGVLGMGNSAYRSAKTYTLGKNISGTVGGLQLIAEGANAEEGSKARQLADNVVEKMQSGEKPYYQLGELYHELARIHESNPFLNDSQKKESQEVISEQGRGYLERLQENINANKTTQKDGNKILNAVKPVVSATVQDQTKERSVQKAYETNLRMVSDPQQLFDERYVKDYADVFTEQLPSSSIVYRELSQYTDDISALLADYTVSGAVPQGTDIKVVTAPHFEAAVKRFQTDLKHSVMNTYHLKNQVYGENTALSEQTRQIQNDNFSVMRQDFRRPVSQAAQSETSSDIQTQWEQNLQPASKEISNPEPHAQYFLEGKDNRNNKEDVNTSVNAKELEKIGMTPTQYAQHTPKKQQVIREYINAVDQNLVDFVKRVQENPSDNRSVYTFNDVSGRAAADIRRLTGIDVTGFGNEAKANAFRHIEKRHGKNGIHDQSMANIEDVGRIEYVIDNYDRMELLDDISKEYRDNKQNPAPIVRYKKQVDGTMYVVEAVPDTKKRKLELVTAYKIKPAQQTRDVQAPTRNVRNASADTDSIESVSQNESAVKDDFEIPPGRRQLRTDYGREVEEIVSADDQTAREHLEKRTAIRVLEHTPSVILDHVPQSRDLPVIINYSKLYLAVRDHGIVKGHYHNLGGEVVKRLPEFLENPDAIIQLGNGRLNVFATIESERGRNGIISVELNSTKDIEGENKAYNVVVTMFNSDDNYVKNLLGKEGVFAVYQNEDLPQVNPQLYKRLATINGKSSSGSSVSQKSKSVKDDFERLPESDETDRWQSEKAEGGTDSREGVKSISDIIQYFSKAFGLPVHTGNIGNPRAAGVYKRGPQTVRTRVTNNLPTISHEIGHYLDRKYHLQQLKSFDTVYEIVDPEFLESYAPEQQPHEAMAEYIRQYLKNRELVTRELPDFTREFQETLSKEDLQKLDHGAAMVNAYFSADADSRIDAAITSRDSESDGLKGYVKRAKETLADPSMTGKEKADAIIAQPLHGVWKTIYRKFSDNLDPIKDASDYVKKTQSLSGSRDAYMLAINSRNASSIASFMLGRGMVDANGSRVGQSLFEGLSEIDHKDIKNFDKYLVLKHALEWMEPKNGERKRVFADEILENPDVIRKQITQMEQEYPAFLNAAEHVYQYQKELMQYWCVDMGGMSQEFFDGLQELYPCYVPFYRAVGKNGKGKRMFANQNIPVKRAKGSGAEILSPLESIAYNTEKMVRFGLQNRVANVLGDYAEQVQGFGQFMERVPPDMVPQQFQMTGYKKNLMNMLRQEETSEDTVSAVTSIIDRIMEDTAVQFIPVRKASKQIITALRNGEYRYFQVHDKALYQTLIELNPKQLEGAGKVRASMLRWTNALITQYNPVFSIGNAKRDFNTAWKLSKVYDNPFSFARAWGAAFLDVVKNSDVYLDYQAAGGGHTSKMSDSIDLIKKQIRELNMKDSGKARRYAYALFRHPLETVTALNEIMETVPRLAEFKGVRKKTGDAQEAIFAAADITTNFSRTGEWGRALNNTFRFSNAAIQGLDKTARTLFRGTKKEILDHWFRFLLDAVAMTALMAAFNRRDPEGEKKYTRLSSYLKNGFYNFYIGEGFGSDGFLRLPKAREVDILNSFAERICDVIMFEDEDAFYHFGEYLNNTLLLPFTPQTALWGDWPEAIHEVLGNTVAGGFADLGFNKDFKGTPIISSTYEDLPPEEQYNDRTTKTAYALGMASKAIADAYGALQERFPILEDMDLKQYSPIEIDHLINTYGGYLGKLNKALLPMDSENIDWSMGVKNTFTSDSVYSTDMYNQIYDRRDKMNLKFKRDSTAANASLLEKYATKAAYISKINKMVKDLPEEEQRDAKRKLQDKLENWDSGISETDRAMVQSFGDAEIGNGYQITTLPDETLSYTSKSTKQKRSYTMTPDEYSEYIDFYLEEVEKERRKTIKKAAYKKADPEEKVELLRDAQKNAKAEAKETYVGKMKRKMKKAE